jgi:geranylgeranyl diphosphate synthase, type II
MGIVAVRTTLRTDDGAVVYTEYSGVLDLGEDGYRRATAGHFIHPCRIGALIACPGDRDLDRFNAFGSFLGAAFQIRDDVLNLVGSRDQYGKEIGGDLYEGKRTLMLAHLFERISPTEKRKLQDLLGRSRHRRLPREIDWVYALLRTHGSIDFAEARARELLEAAGQAFEPAYERAPDSDDKAFLEQSVGYMADRRS